MMGLLGPEKTFRISYNSSFLVLLYLQIVAEQIIGKQRVLVTEFAGITYSYLGSKSL